LTDSGRLRRSRRVSACAALYVVEGDRIRHDASADLLLMRIVLLLRQSN
jgi:hypothetical protein